MGKGPPTGALLAGRLSDLLASTLTKHKVATLPIEADHAARVRDVTAKQLESEGADFFREILDMLRTTEDAPPELVAILDRLSSPDHLIELAALLPLVIGFMIGIALRAGQPFVQAIMNKLWHAFESMPLPPDVAALANIRGELDDASAFLEASYSGIDADRFDKMLKTTGEPLALQELLLLERRGEISETDLEHGIRQSRVRNEWIDAAKKLRYFPPSPAQAIAAEVEGHLTKEETIRHMAEAGLNPVNHDWLYETAGRPPGPAEMGDMWHRKIITEEQFRQGIKESDVKNKYIDDLIKASEYLPPVRSIGILLRHGAITEPQAAQLWMENGVPQWLATAYVKVAQDQRTTTTKTLGIGEVRAAYQDRIITRDQAKSMLEALKFTPQDSELEVEIIDFARARQYQNAYLSRIHSLYVGHKIDATDMQKALSGLEVPPDQRRQIVELWTLERDANVRVLTEAQVVKAVKLGIIDATEGLTRLVEMGYDSDDGKILLEEAAPGTKPPKSRKAKPSG